VEAAEKTVQVEHQVCIQQSLLAATLHVDDYLDLDALKLPDHCQPVVLIVSAGIDDFSRMRPRFPSAG
jgi:hypothetical protein